MTAAVLSLLISFPALAETPDVPDAEVVGLAQTWLTALDEDQSPVADPGGYGDPEDDSGFKLRRVRLGIEGKSDSVKYGITVGASAPYDVVAEAQGSRFELGLVDAYGGYSPSKGVWLAAGLQKVPVSREALMASGQLGFTERAVSTNWLTPGRDLGAVVDYRWKFLRTRIGAFNGSGTLAGDDNEGKLFAGRVEAKLGDGAVYRTYGSVESFTLGIGLDGWMNKELATSHRGFGADLIVRAGGLAVLVEARRTAAEPNDELLEVPGVFVETERQGLMAQVGYTVGSVEPLVRYSVFDDDLGVEDTGDVSELMSGVTWHGESDSIRAGLGYVLRSEHGPIKVSNDTIRAWLQLKI